MNQSKGSPKKKKSSKVSSSNTTSDTYNEEINKLKNFLYLKEDNPITQYDIKHFNKICRHINRVIYNCDTLAEQLMEIEESELERNTGISWNKDHIALRLMATSRIHDNSKFFGIEWLYLRDTTRQNDPDLFYTAYAQHVTTNSHHPEAWPYGIREMPNEYLCEMISDWKARSDEMATDLKQWLDGEATKKYEIQVGGNLHNKIKYLMDLLLDTPFT